MSKNTCCPTLPGPFGSRTHDIEPQTASPPQLTKRTFVLPSSLAHSPFTSPAQADGMAVARMAALASARSIVFSHVVERQCRRTRGRTSSRSAKRRSPFRSIPRRKRRHRRRRRQNVDLDSGPDLKRLSIAGEAPRRQRSTPERVGATLPNDHRTVRQHAEPRTPDTLPSVMQSLAMQDLVHRVRAEAGAVRKGGQERFCRRTPTLEARPVTCCERGRLVEKEKLRIAAPPHLAPSALESANADDPALVRPAPPGQRSVVAMEPSAAVAHHRAAGNDSVKVSERIDPVLQRPPAIRDRRRFALRGHLSDAPKSLGFAPDSAHGAPPQTELRILRQGSARELRRGA